MFTHALSLSAAVPNSVLDMTADLTPLLSGLVVVVGLGVLALAFAIGFHDTQKAQREAEKAAVTPAPLPKAA
jgi:hypothetical protein